MARFDGIPVDEPARKPRFSGELVEAAPEPAMQQAAAPTPVREPGPNAGSPMARVIDFFSGPSPLQGSTVEERRQDYQSRPAALRAVVGSGQAVDSLLRGVDQIAGTGSFENDNSSRAFNQVLEGDLPTLGGRLVADALMTAVPAGRVSAIPRFGARLAGGVGLGATHGALQAEDAPGGRMMNALTGGAFGGVGEAGGTALRALGMRITPEVLAMYNRAKELGIDVLPSQLSNSSFVNRLQGMLRNIPANGAQQALENQQQQFTRAVGSLIGAKGDKLTPDVFATARQNISNEFKRLTATNTMSLSDSLLGRLGEIEKEAVDFADDGSIKAVKNIIERVMTQSEGSSLPGRAYQSIDSQLGRLAAAGGEKGYFLGQVREALRDAMDTSIKPSDSRAWMAARQKWRDMLTIEPLVAKSTDGVVPPAQLMGRVTADKPGMAAMAQGRRGELGDLARLGQELKPPQTSGSAENILAGGVLNPANWPGLVSGLLVGRTLGTALNSPGLSNMLVRTNASRPAIANALARLPLPASSALASLARGPVAAPVVPETRRPDNSR